MGCKASKQAETPRPTALETATSIRTTRLEQSRSTISAACAEYNFLNPTHGGRIQIPPASPSDPLLSDTEQMKQDLRTLHERILEPENWEADEAYRRLAHRVKERANEASREKNDVFSLAWFREAVRGELERFVVLGDLDTLVGWSDEPQAGFTGDGGRAEGDA